MTAESADRMRQGRYRDILRRVPWLAHLPEADLDALRQQLRQRRYAAGETILRSGVHGGFLGIVAAGQVSVVSGTPGGRRLASTLHPGEFFALERGVPSAATIRAVTPTVLWTLYQTDVAALRRRPPSPARAPSRVSRRTRAWLRFGRTILVIAVAWVILTSAPAQRFLADVHYARGVWYLERGQVAAASQEFDEALKRNPAHAASLNGLGYIYRQQGQTGEALAAFEQAARLDAGSDVIQNNLGVVRSDLGRPDEALKNLHQAAELDGNVPQIYVNLGNVSMMEGDWLNAGRAYQEALRLSPRLALTHYNLGVVYYHQRQLANAQAEFERALELQPDLAAAYLGLGIIDFEAEAFDSAEAAFRRAVELDGRDATAYFYLGLTHKQLNSREQAIGAFERAVGLTSDPVVREQAEWQLKALWGLP